MAVVVVGGHTRNIGKTTLAAQVMAATVELRWTAMKITQYGHDICSGNGGTCDCAGDDHAVAVSEERSHSSGTDTARMRAAGAARVLWVRTQQGQLHQAMPRVRKEIFAAENMLIESNSVLRFLQPDVYLAVLQPSVADFKPSASHYIDRADALFVPEGAVLESRVWQGVHPSLLQNKPVFPLYEGGLAPSAERWLRERLALSRRRELAKSELPARP